MRMLVIVIVGFVLVVIASAESIDLMTRYVETTWSVNQLTGVKSDERRSFTLQRSRLKITTRTEGGTSFIVFTAVAGEGNDKSEESEGTIPFSQQKDILKVLKEASSTMAKANMAVTPTDGSQQLWSSGGITLTMITQPTTPRALVELIVGDRTYVLRTVPEFEKLNKAISRLGTAVDSAIVRPQPIIQPGVQAPAREPANKDEVLPELLTKSQMKNITATMSGGRKQSSGIVLKNERLTSEETYSPPLAIEYVCKTDSTNIRLSFGCDELIFNWEVDQDDLRVGGGPVGGQHRPGSGRIPINTFVTIRQVVTKRKMDVFVEDKLRASWQGDFTDVNSPISVFSSHGSTVTVKSIRVTELGH